MERTTARTPPKPAASAGVSPGARTRHPADAASARAAQQIALTVLAACGDHQMARTVLAGVSSYQELIGLTLAERGARFGAWAVQLRLPTHPLPLDTPTSADDHGLRLLACTDPQWPQQLEDLHNPPALIEVIGRLPRGPLVTVGGTQRPGEAGKAAARQAAAAAHQLQAPLAAMVDGGCGQQALREAVRAGHAAIAVTPYRLGRPSLDDLMLRDIVAAGGAALRVWSPAGGQASASVHDAARVAAALGRAVVLAELGVYAGGGALLARTAVELDRYLIVPHPGSDLDTPVEASGGAVLARARRFSDEWFGSSPRVAARVAAGRPAADAVVSDRDGLIDALRWGLGLGAPPAAAPRPQPAGPSTPPAGWTRVAV